MLTDYFLNIESTKDFTPEPFMTYNIADMYASGLFRINVAEPEATIDHIINVGDKFASSWDDSVFVEIVMRGEKWGEVIFRYDDLSIGYAENEDDFFEQGFIPIKLSAWMNVIHDNEDHSLFFDGPYETKEDALDGVSDYSGWTLIDTIEITWEA